MTDHDIHAKDVLVKDVLTVMRHWHADRLTSVQETWIRAVLEAHLPGPRQGDLFAPAPPRESTRITRLVTRMLCGDETYHDPLARQTLKLASVISDLRMGRPERVQSWEASAVEAVIGPVVIRTPDALAPDVAPSDPVPVHYSVEFTFPWPSGSARAPRTDTSTALAALSEVDPVDAPVACSLQIPAGRLEVRRLDSQWLRPVLAPGSWEPITPAGFRRAAGSGAAWRDNPFLPRVPRGCPNFRLVDPAPPAAMAAGDGRRSSQARDACLARAGQLFVIGGVVHRSTEVPRAGICAIQAGGVTRTYSAWAMGDLGSTCVMDTLADREGLVLTWFNGTCMPDHAGGQDPDGVFVPVSDWVSLIRSMSDATPGSASMHGVVPPFSGDLVRLADAHPSAGDARACLEGASTLAERLLPIPHGPDPGRVAADPFVRLRDAIRTASATPGVAGGELRRAYIGLRRSCADVVDAMPPTRVPRDDMWVYVASLASHAARLALDPLTDDEGLVSVRL